jgi:FliI/YscN family ATPase
MSRIRDLSQKLPDQSVTSITSGRVVGVQGPLILARMPGANLGEICEVKRGDQCLLEAQVVSFNEDIVKLAAFSALDGIGPGMEVCSLGTAPTIEVNRNLLGCVLDPLGNVLYHTNGKKQFGGNYTRTANIYANSPDPICRDPITTQLETGIKAIDLFLPIGLGQRMGLFAGAGAGKSTLLGMIARNASADVNVIALIGERGREVREFLDDCLGVEGLKKSIVVVATSDDSSNRRRLAANTATAVAEYFRSQGKRVLLLVDSLTRMARAIREVGLAAGEFPVRHGYTSSVYTELPRLLERAGTDTQGSITAIYTILQNNSGDPDPLAEELKSLLDGHMILEPEIALRGIRPAIDLTQSVSRLTNRLLSDADLQQLQAGIQLVGKLQREKDFMLLGGTPDAELEAAVSLEGALQRLLSQSPDSCHSLTDARQELKSLLEQYRQKVAEIKSRGNIQDEVSPLTM